MPPDPLSDHLRRISQAPPRREDASPARPPPPRLRPPRAHRRLSPLRRRRRLLPLLRPPPPPPRRQGRLRFAAPRCRHQGRPEEDEQLRRVPDMSGRRLGHVNAERRLEEWRAEAEGRKLEKIAEEFIRKKEKEEKRKKKFDGEVDKYMEKYREDAAKRVQAVEESVRESFRLYKEAKRKVLPAAGPDAKRLKIWLEKKQMDESDSDEDDHDNAEEDGDEKSVVLDTRSCEVRIEDDGAYQRSVSGTHSEGEFSGHDSLQSNLEEENGSCEKRHVQMTESSASDDSNADSAGLDKRQTGVFGESDAQETVTVVSSLEELPVSTYSKLGMDRPVGCDVNLVEPVELEDRMERSVGSVVAHEEHVVQSSIVCSSKEVLDFAKFDSASELEVLGMERLKRELQTRGLKCGGTLQERAARLLLLKTTPVEKLLKKVLAKAGGDGK